METSTSDNTTDLQRSGPAWASWLGVVAIVLGVLLTAAHGNEWMKQIVITQATPASDRLPPAECPKDELIEEGLSLAECQQMVANVRNFTLSAPDWFPAFQATLAAVGTAVAFISIIIGAALLNYRGWAPAVAILTFGALAAIDVIGFIGALNTGPILRDVYLWNFLLWFSIHLMMTVGVIAGRASRSVAQSAPE
ncbi:MAG: hypothetical protein ACREVE_09580 [Gammaproteobacteria bacterium]